MKYGIFIFFLPFCLWSGAQEIPFNLNIPDTVYYPLSDDRQFIEIDREGAWQREVDWFERSQPRAMHWSQLIKLPERNVLLICNKQHTVIQLFNTSQPASYWNSLLRPAPIYRPQATEGRIKLGGNNYIAHSFRKSGAYMGFQRVYMGNQRVRTHMPNNFFLVNHVIPAPPQSSHILDGKHLGVIDSLGQFILPIIFEYVEAVGEDFLVKKNGLFGIMDKRGRIVISLVYESAVMRDDGSVVLERNGRGRKVYKSKIGGI